MMKAFILESPVAATGPCLVYVALQQSSSNCIYQMTVLSPGVSRLPLRLHGKVLCVLVVKTWLF